MRHRPAPIRYLDEPEFDLSGQWRTARKPHRCDECQATINPGDRYYEYTGEAPAFQTGDAYCKPCAVVYWRKWAPGGEYYHT